MDVDGCCVIFEPYLHWTTINIHQYTVGLGFGFEDDLARIIAEADCFETLECSPQSRCVLCTESTERTAQRVQRGTKPLAAPSTTTSKQRDWWSSKRRWSMGTNLDCFECHWEFPSCFFHIFIYLLCGWIFRLGLMSGLFCEVSPQKNWSQSLKSSKHSQIYLSALHPVLLNCLGCFGRQNECSMRVSSLSNAAWAKAF